MLPPIPLAKMPPFQVALREEPQHTQGKRLLVFYVKKDNSLYFEYAATQKEL